MKTILYLFLFTVSISAARAQDAACATGQSADCQAPAVVYDAPVVYTAPVAYEAPVVYNAPVYYTTAASCAPVTSCVVECRPVRSTVTYIGGGHVRYQRSHYNCGSTVTVIGRH